MMGHFSHLGTCRKDVRKISFPLCRVRTLSEAAHGGGVKHRFDASAHPASCFGLLAPDRVEHLHDQTAVDGSHREITQSRMSVSFERISPLLPVLGITP